MSRFHPLTAAACACSLLISSSVSAGDAPADEAYFRDLAETRNYTLGHPVSPKLTPDGSAVIFLRGGARDPVLRLYEMSIPEGKVREILTPEKILAGVEETLSAEEKARRERQRQSLRGFTSFQLSKDGTRLLVVLSGKLYVVARADLQVAELPGRNWLDPRFSPDGKFIAAVSGGELHVIDVEARKERAITSGANGIIEHGVAEFVAQEEMARTEGYWWSPDSRSIAYQETDHTGVEARYISDPLHPEVEPARNYYPRPGTTNANVRIGIISRDGGETRWIKWEAEKFPYVARVIWKEEKAPLCLLVQARSQQDERLLAVDPANGSTRELLRETDPAWLNLDPGSGAKWLADGSGFLWATERGGGWQLEFRNADGAFRHAVTPREFGNASLVALEDASQSAVVSGGADPRETHLYRFPLAGGSAGEPLTREPGQHQAVFAPGVKAWLHRFELGDGGLGWEVCDATGKLLCALPSVAESPRAWPQVEHMRIRAGEREFDAAIVRPRDFKKGVRYPVLLEVYAGPGHKVVRLQPRAFLPNQWNADRGYIVVSIDGRGTPGHGRDWERAIRGDFIDIALEDQTAGLRALGARFAELDLTRVGVEGWSFGGYFSAMATIRRPEIFACGIAGAPVVTWENYDTHYTERYLGLPQENAAAYRAGSVLTYAAELKRPLLLVHGATDDNVYFQHSVQLADALYRAGKPYEFLPLLGTHMLSDPLLRLRRAQRAAEFFDRNLKKPAATAAP